MCHADAKYDQIKFPTTQRMPLFQLQFRRLIHDATNTPITQVHKNQSTPLKTVIFIFIDAHFPQTGPN